MCLHDSPAPGGWWDSVKVIARLPLMARGWIQHDSSSHRLLTIACISAMRTSPLEAPVPTCEKWGGGGEINSKNLIMLI